MPPDMFVVQSGKASITPAVLTVPVITVEEQMEPKPLVEDFVLIKPLKNNLDVHQPKATFEHAKDEGKTWGKITALLGMFLITLGWGGCNITVMIAARMDPSLSLLSQISALITGKWAALLLSHRLPKGGLRGIFPRAPLSRDWPSIFAILHGPMSALAFCMFTLALEGSTGGAALVGMSQLHALAPICFGAWVLKEKVTSSKAIGIVFILCGVCMLGVDGAGNGEIKLGSLMLMLFCVILWGTTYTIASVYQKIHPSLDSFVEALYFGDSIGVGALLIANVIIVSHEELVPTSPAILLLFLSQFLNEPFMLIYSSLGVYIDASVLSPIGQLFNLYPILFSILVFGESLTLLKVCGCVLTILGAISLGLTNKSVSDKKPSLFGKPDDKRVEIVTV